MPTKESHLKFTSSGNILRKLCIFHTNLEVFQLLKKHSEIKARPIIFCKTNIFLQVDFTFAKSTFNLKLYAFKKFLAQDFNLDD